MRRPAFAARSASCRFDIAADLLPCNYDRNRLAGYDVAAVANGSQAFDYLQRQSNAGHSMAAMVLDLTVPGEMVGEEAIAPIRRLAPSLPVFVASGYADDPVMANPQAYGFTASISKPFGKAELAGMLSRRMKG